MCQSTSFLVCPESALFLGSQQPKFLRIDSLSHRKIHRKRISWVTLAWTSNLSYWWWKPQKRWMLEVKTGVTFVRHPLARLANFCWNSESGLGCSTSKLCEGRDSQKDNENKQRLRKQGKRRNFVLLSLEKKRKLKWEMLIRFECFEW